MKDWLAILLVVTYCAALVVAFLLKALAVLVVIGLVLLILLI